MIFPRLRNTVAVWQNIRYLRDDVASQARGKLSLIIVCQLHLISPQASTVLSMIKIPPLKRNLVVVILRYSDDAARKAMSEFPGID